jgi:hypothetical protein
MSGATRSQERRLTRNDGQDAPTADEQDPSLDTLIAALHGLAINCEPDHDSLLSFEPTDKILRLTRTSETGRVMLHRSNGPTEVMLDWTLTAWPGKAEKKTLSILIQGHGLLPVVAKSGWGKTLNQDTSEDIYSPINGTDYTEMAWRLCRSVGCELKPDGIDRKDRPGYFKASHAEMHLITWFVERYFPRLLEDGAENWRLQLPLFLENILIISNRKLYPCYRELANRVEELTGVTITIEYRGPGV